MASILCRGNQSTVLPESRPTQPTHLFNFSYNAFAKNAHKPTTRVQIEICGIPSHLCTDNTVKTLLMQLCSVKEITFCQATRRYWVDAVMYCPEAIPPAAHIGISKMEAHQPYIHVWPIWYEPVPLETSDDQNQQYMEDEAARRLGYIQQTTATMMRLTLHSDPQVENPHAVTVQSACAAMNTESSSSGGWISMDSGMLDHEPKY